MKFHATALRVGIVKLEIEADDKADAVEKAKVLMRASVSSLDDSIFDDTVKKVSDTPKPFYRLQFEQEDSPTLCMELERLSLRP